MASLAWLMGEAVGTLCGALQDPGASVSVKIRVDSLILEHVQKLTTFADLE